MRSLVIAGGSGHVGQLVSRTFREVGWTVTVLTRKPRGAVQVCWDGKSLGEWTSAIDGADVVLNLAGRSVNCRYTDENLREMMNSRVDSTRVIGQAIQQSKTPPAVWLQSSTATIYAHRFDAPNDEATGIIAGDEVDVPPHWAKSVDIAKAWERELETAETPGTRKVALRSAMTMSADRGSVFDVLSGLARRGLGGTIDRGRQYVSWIHGEDFCRALSFLIDSDMAGAVNLASPNPLPQAEFMAIMREAWGVQFGLPTPKILLEIGTRAMKTESELVLKSRRVVPTRLIEAGFSFQFPDWKDACRDLIKNGSQTIV